MNVNGTERAIKCRECLAAKPVQEFRAVLDEKWEGQLLLPCSLLNVDGECY